MVKLDTGMIAFLVITCLTFDNKEAWFDILDSCFLLVAVVQAFVFRKMVRNENFRKVVFWLVLRFLFDVFKLYRNIKFITKEDKSKDFFVDNFGETIVIGALVLNEIIFLLIIFASFVCERNFGKGLKEMILEQNQNLEFAGDL